MGYEFANQEDEDRSLKCAIGVVAGDESPEIESACKAAFSAPKKAHSISASLDWDNLFALLRDVAIGLLVPALVVLFLPRVLGKYLRWLAS